MSGLLRQLTAFLLVVTLTAMGFAAATARGQTTVGGQVVVLCSDGGLVQLTLDENGNPTGGSHLCPDLAATLLAAVTAAPPAILRPEVRAEPVAPREPRYLSFPALPAERARDPPVSL